ncbi:hypothetical protein [Variovorax sp. AFSI2.2]|uniref:hypothetical protein n=1 Tax=Variovorax sp. AFSI2.2 TaxID=3384160 RepID=UPI003EBBD91D
MALATTPAEQLLGLPLIRSTAADASLHAYQISKRGNSLRVMAEAVRWGKRGAGYRHMLEASPVGRAGTHRRAAGSPIRPLAKAEQFVTLAFSR